MQMNCVEFPNFAHPAPYTLRPFAGVYNPFPYGCSILCNHPADYEAKDIVKRAKESWVSIMFLSSIIHWKFEHEKYKMKVLC